jgi:predicted ester cyclase
LPEGLFGPGQPQEKDGSTVDVDHNKQLVRRKIALWYEPNSVEQLRALVSDGYVHHGAQGNLDFDEFAAQLGYLAAAFSEPEFTIVHVVAEGELAAAFITYRAIHTGDFAGLAATGCEVSTVGAYHCRIADGVVQEDWDAWGLLSIVRQIEAASPA